MNNIFGIDFGTCNIKFFSKPSGKIYSEKNTVAIINKNQLYAYGDNAYAMFEKAPETIEVSFPVVNGIIAQFNSLQTMFFSLLEQYTKSRLKGSEYIVAVPTDITEVEKKAFFDIFYKSKEKPKNVMLCEKPIADAVGLDLDVTIPTGIMIVDIGADTTEISVISLGGLVLSNLLHFGGNRLDNSIIKYIRENNNLMIGKKTATMLKETIGAAIPGNPDNMTIVGRDVVNGLPIEVNITSDMIYNAIKPDLDEIINDIKIILEKTPPELARDIIASGIHITGGSSKIRQFDELITQVTNIRVNTYENPEESVVRGLLKISSEPSLSNLAFGLKVRSYK